MAFWDASAIVPLCCSQPVTAERRRLQRELKRIVVWWGTPLEARSAFARLVREGRLTTEERMKAVRLLRQLRAGWDEIQPTEKVRSLPTDALCLPVKLQVCQFTTRPVADETRLVRAANGE